MLIWHFQAQWRRNLRVTVQMWITNIFNDERQCTYNVIRKRVRETVFTVEKQSVLHITNMCLYPYLSSIQCACTIFIVLCGLRICHIFPNFLVNGAIFGNKLLNIKCVFWFSVQFSSQIFLILWNIQRDTLINVLRASCKLPIILFKCYWKLNFLERLSKHTEI